MLKAIKTTIVTIGITALLCYPHLFAKWQVYGIGIALNVAIYSFLYLKNCLVKEIKELSDDYIEPVEACDDCPFYKMNPEKVENFEAPMICEQCYFYQEYLDSKKGRY